MDRAGSQKAFSLVEVMIAMMIFAMVIGGGLLGVRQSYKLVDESRHHVRASQVLQSELELLRTLPWSTFSALSSSQLTTAFQDQIAEQFGANVYTGTVTITSSEADLIKIQVTVSWTGLSNRTQTMSYFTYFTDGGVNDYYL